MMMKFNTTNNNESETNIFTRADLNKNTMTSTPKFLQNLRMISNANSDSESDNNPSPITSKKHTHSKYIPSNDRNFQSSVELLKNILGDDVSIEKIRNALKGADGQPDIALNHLLNDKEKERARNDLPADSNSLNPLEKVLCELAEEVKCPMCLGYFRTPLVLECFHTFCKECLEELITDSSILCPLCRNTTTLTDRGVNALKPNHYLSNIIEKLKSAQSTKMCAECQKSLCTIFCKQCKGFLCTECDEKIHSMRVMINHHRIPFEDLFFDNPVPISQNFDISCEFDCVIPFNVKKEVCMDLFYFWLKELWFAPSDLAKRAIVKDFKAQFVPYWLFEVEADSNYTSLVGYSTNLFEGLSIRGRGKNIGVEVPATLSVNHVFTDIAVCGGDSNIPEMSLLTEFEPWKLEQIQPFTLKHVEGVDVLPFHMESEKAWQNLAKPKLDQLNKELCEKKLKKNTGTGSLSNISMETSFTIKSSRRLFVPIYSTTYEYRGNTYLFLINGSTAKVNGQRTYSTGKLASLSVTGIGAAIGLISSRMHS